jgi:hypothetical protein
VEEYAVKTENRDSSYPSIGGTTIENPSPMDMKDLPNFKYLL